MKLHVASKVFMVLFSLSISSTEEKKNLPPGPEGKLYFIHIEGYKKHCENLEEWIRSKIQSNSKAQDLLKLSLKNGDIKVIFEAKQGFSASYTTPERTIKIDVDFSRIDPFVLAKCVNFINLCDASITTSHHPKLQLSKLLVNNTLRCLLFELGNSVNDALSLVFPNQFSCGKDFARAMEIAEFETQRITIPILKYGVEYCNWDKDAFVVSDLEVLRDKHYNETDEHYQFYVNQYNEHWIFYKLHYVFHKIFSCCLWRLGRHTKEFV